MTLSSTHDPSAMAVHQVQARRPHIGALDGLRGIAILLVMFHHTTLLHVAALPDRVVAWGGGMAWCGVDLFFVLSGFLITGILYETRSGRCYFRQFYARRTLRIFPLYYAVLFVYLVLLPHSRFGNWMPKDAAPVHAVWYWTYLSNVAMARAGAFSISILSITWSLAIEEQFYLFWPVVVLLFERKTLLWIAAAAILLPPILRIALVLRGTNPIALYVLTPFRIESLASGAWIALACRNVPLHRMTRAAWAICGASLVLLAALFFVQGNPTIYGKPMQTIGYTVVAIFFAGVLVISAAAKPGTMIHWLTNLSILRTFGRYSYALYLIHPAIIVVLRRSPLRPETFATWHQSHLPGQFVFYVVAVTAALALAVMSWHLLEKHFLKLKYLFPYEDRPAAIIPG